MKKYAYYHLYLTDDIAAWSLYLLDNHKKMEDSGLLDELEKIHLVVIGNPRNIHTAWRLSVGLSDKYVFNAFEHNIDDSEMVIAHNKVLNKNDNHITENVTLKKLYDHACREDAYFLYNHSKGITTFQKYLKDDIYPIHIDYFINNYYWKEFLSWGVIDKWRECVDVLDNFYDTVAANYSTGPEPHYSGNIWWSKSSHIRNLPDPSLNDWWYDIQSKSDDLFIQNASIRFKDEMWVCSKKDTNSYNMMNLEPKLGSAYLFQVRAPKKLYA